MRRLLPMTLSLSVVSCLLVVSGVRGAPQTVPDRADLTTFSGTWQGTTAWMQSGACGMNGGQRSEVRTALVIEVSQDGTFRAREHPRDVAPSANQKLPWQGQVQPDLSVTITAPAMATCGGQSREYKIDY